MATVSVLGIDLGKNVCSLVGLDSAGKAVLRRRVRREGLASLVDKVSPCIVAMEACCGAHHFARNLLGRGYDVRLMSPEYVRPYVKAQKNDDRDAEAIAEAATRPTMRFVAVKSQTQLDMQTLHRVRDRLVGGRTALVNQLRAILLERGIILPQGIHKLEHRLVELSYSSALANLDPRMQALLDELRSEWEVLNERIETFDKEFAVHARTDEAARRLSTIPGIGVMNATALASAIGDGRAFAKARDLSAWLGLVPRQTTTGGKPRLHGISKRGNRYLRKLLIHGARAALPGLAKGQTALGAWLQGLLKRAHYNTVVVALANKLARIAWAVLRSDGGFVAMANLT